MTSRLGSDSRGLVGGVLGTILKVLVVLVVVVALLWAVGILRTPGVSVADPGDWGNVSEETTEVKTEVNVTSPFGFDFAWGGASVDYELYMNGVRMAEGDKSGIALEPGTQTKVLTSELDNRKLPDWWVEYVRANETIDMRVEGKASATLVLTGTHDFSVERTMLENETPMISAMSRAASDAEGEYPEARPLYEVERGWATWGEVTENRTNLQFHFRVRNPTTSPLPAPIRAFDASVEANGVRLLYTENGDLFSRIEGADTIPPGESEEFVVTVAIDNEQIDDWFTRHVRRGEVTDLSIGMEMRLGDQNYEVPIADYDCQLRTGILVDDQQTATNCGDPGSVGASTAPAVTAPGVDGISTAPQIDQLPTAPRPPATP